MRIIFMGTPDFAATILDDLVQQQEVVAVYTRPDAIRGRGKKLAPSAVKQVAEREGVPVETPRSLRDPEVVEKIKSYRPDIICVAAYGAILPREVLDIPQYGCLNVHASLLPRWRGAAPVERAILAGDEETGVCIMRMEEGLDTGDYCICRTASIEKKTADELSDELANLGSRALITALVHVEADAAEWIEQDDSLVTYAEKIKKGELDIEESDTREMFERKVRASSEAHPSRMMIADKSLTVLEVRMADGYAVGLQEVAYQEKKLLMGLADGVVELLRVKPDGKQAMEAMSFASGIQGIKNTVLRWSSIHVEN